MAACKRGQAISCSTLARHILATSSYIICNVYNNNLYNNSVKQLYADWQCADCWRETQICSDRECPVVEAHTKQQSEESLWFQQWCLRLTASNFGKVGKWCDTTPVANLVKTLLYRKVFSTAATQWSLTHKEDAWAAYIQYLHQQGHSTVTTIPQAWSLTWTNLVWLAVQTVLWIYLEWLICGAFTNWSAPTPLRRSWWYSRQPLHPRKDSSVRWPDWWDM